MMKRKRIEMARAGEMAGPVIGGRPRIDEDQVGIAAMFHEPSRVNQEFSVLCHSRVASGGGWRLRNSLSRRAADRFANRAKSVACEQAHEAALDFARQPRPAINHRGVELDQAGAGAQMAVGVVGGGDSTNTDKRNVAAGFAIDLRDDLARSREQRRAAETAGEGRADANFLA